MVYRFIDENKKIFGLRWLCQQFGISPNCYYNYKKDAKREYHKRLAHIFELIKYVYYNNNRVIGYRAMRIFIKRYGYEVSNTTMHKYMNKELNLCAVIMHSKPGYKTGKKHKIFDNLLNQNFTVDCKNKVWCTDFTYMRQPNGKFRYNCSIIDLFDRSAVASLNSNYINTDLAIETLKKALEQEHYPEVILHSDYAEEKIMPKNLITSCILIIRIQFFGIVFRVSQARRLLSLYQRSSTAFRHRQLWEQTC